MGQFSNKGHTYMTKTLKSLFYYNSRMEIMAEIAITIEELKNYFRKFNGSVADEAMARAYMHACRKYSTNLGDLKPYIKSLARHIMLTDEKDIPNEEIESMAVDNSTSVEELAMEELQFNSVKDKMVSTVLMADLEAFLKLGHLLNNKEALSKVFLNKSFKNICTSVLATTDSGSFVTSVRMLYEQYQDIILWFLEQADFKTENAVKYRSYNGSYINKMKSRRAILVGIDNKPINRVLKENEKLRLRGYTTGKKIYRVYYYELLNQIMMKADSYTTNELVLVIGKNRLVRTCGGTFTEANSSWEDLYDLFFHELLTNILASSKCRLLTYCYNYVYLLGEDDYVGDTIQFKGMVGFGDIELGIERVDFDIV